MGREARRHNQQNTGSHAAPTRGRRVLNIADNPKRPRASQQFRLYNSNEESRIPLADSNSIHWPNLCQVVLAFSSMLVRKGNIPVIERA